MRIGANGPYLVELEECGAKLYATSRDGGVTLSPHEDLEAMQRAAERLQSRVYGRPRQGDLQVETRVEEKTTPEDFDRQVKELQDEMEKAVERKIRERYGEMEVGDDVKQKVRRETFEAVEREFQDSIKDDLMRRRPRR